MEPAGELQKRCRTGGLCRDCQFGGRAQLLANFAVIPLGWGAACMSPWGPGELLRPTCLRQADLRPGDKLADPVDACPGGPQIRKLEPVDCEPEVHLRFVN